MREREDEWANGQSNDTVERLISNNSLLMERVTLNTFLSRRRREAPPLEMVVGVIILVLTFWSWSVLNEREIPSSWSDRNSGLRVGDESHGNKQNGFMALFVHVLGKRVITSLGHICSPNVEICCLHVYGGILLLGSSSGFSFWVLRLGFLSKGMSMWLGPSQANHIDISNTAPAEPPFRILIPEGGIASEWAASSDVVLLRA